MDKLVAIISNINWRLVFVGLSMLAVAGGSIYTLVATAKAIQARKSSSEVVLPDLNKEGNEVESVSKFEMPEEFEVELIDEDLLEPEVFSKEIREDDEFFIEAITMETGVFIPKEEVDANLPDVDSVKVETKEERVIEELDEEVISDEVHGELEALEEEMFNNDGEVEELHYEVVSKSDISNNEVDNKMFEDLLEDILEEDTHA